MAIDTVQTEVKYQWNMIETGHKNLDIQTQQQWNLNLPFFQQDTIAGIEKYCDQHQQITDITVAHRQEMQPLPLGHDIHQPNKRQQTPQYRSLCRANF